MIASSESDIGSIDSFKALDSISGTGVIFSLPDDQWLKELSHWESVSWTALQTIVADYAIGPASREPTAKNFVKLPTSNAERTLCQAQKMRKPGGFV